MTPDRLLSKEDPRLKITQEALVNLSQIVADRQINLRRIIGNNKNRSEFPGLVPEQVPKIESQLTSLSELLFGLSQNPAAFTLVEARAVTAKSGASGHEIILVRSQDPQGNRRLYFREIAAGNNPQVYAAALEAGRRDPFRSKIAVPEISIFSVGSRAKSILHLLIGRGCFSFPPHWAETMGEQKINLLALFIKTSTEKFLASRT